MCSAPPDNMMGVIDNILQTLIYYWLHLVITQKKGYRKKNIFFIKKYIFFYLFYLKSAN
jgi:hypothetical protein